MDPLAIRPGADQLRALLESWQHPDFVLRPVQPEETEVAAELILAASREIRTPTDASIRGTRASCADASRLGNVFLFVEQAGVPAGLLRAELYPAAEGRREFYISHISLRPQLRSAGLGRLLMGHLERWAAGVGAQAMTLDFMADNRRVEPFYRRLGFEVVGYDLLQKLPASNSSARRVGASGSASVARVRSYEPADLARVLHFLQARQGLRTFEQPLWTETDLAARLQALVTDPQHVLFLVERQGSLAGLCWSLWRQSKSGAPLVIAICFESDDLETSALLLDAQHHLSLEHAAAESYVTLWQPPAGQLELALERGYAFGRYKLRKSLALSTP